MPYSPQLILPRGTRKQNRWVRHFRAVWHDTNALFREFRRPLIAIFFSLIVGGIVYGELAVLAGYDRIPVYDLPYIMLALMVIENPLDYVPAEWYLIIFWYVQPALGVYIVSRGAVDFIRLFFNRDERKSAWELAVAQTYRNHVILIGVGHVGMRVARTLTQMGFELVAIDEAIGVDADQELTGLGVPVIVGDGRSITTLNDAGIKYARSLIVCTSNDHINLELTMRARDLNPEIPIVTRMWDGRFAEQLKRFLSVEVMSASDLAAPAFAGAAVGIEITQTLKVGGVDFSMIQLVVAEGTFMDGQTIETLQAEEDIDIVLYGQKEQEPIVHPDGDILVRSGDTLVLFAQHSKIVDIVARNRPIANTIQ